MAQTDIPDDVRAELCQIAAKTARDTVALLSIAEWLNRTNMAKYLSCSPGWLDKIVKLGAPVSIVDGKKLYSKRAMNAWLNQFRQ